MDPWQGQRTVSPSSLPPESLHPICVHLFLIAKIVVPVFTTRISLPSTTTPFKGAYSRSFTVPIFLAVMVPQFWNIAGNCLTMPSESASINHVRSIFFFLFKGCRKFFFNLLKINRIFHFLKQNLKKLLNILPDSKPLRHHPRRARSISAAILMQDCRVLLLLLPGRYLYPLHRCLQRSRRWSPSLLLPGTCLLTQRRSRHLPVQPS
jgi:hypothetical protein